MDREKLYESWHARTFSRRLNPTLAQEKMRKQGFFAAIDVVGGELESLRAQLTTLTAKLEAAEKDAARYRWLHAEHEVINPLAAVCWKRNADRSESDWVNTVDGKWLDSAIDAALAQNGKG